MVTSPLRRPMAPTGPAKWRSNTYCILCDRMQLKVRFTPARCVAATCGAER